MKQIQKTVALCLAFGVLAAGCSAENTHRGAVKGYGGDVNALITVENGRIKALEVKGPGETAAIGGVALEKLNTEILPQYLNREIDKVNFSEIDAISQATVTCQAAVQALKEAQQKAG